MNSQYPLVGKSWAVFAGATFAMGVLYAWEAAGLPKKPAGERIDLDPVSGEIVGLS